MADLTLAIAHHLLIFSLAGVLAFEIGAIRPSMTSEDVVRIFRADRWYGVLAAAILLVGFTRAIKLLAVKLRSRPADCWS
jgi:putative membrane protein